MTSRRPALYGCLQELEGAFELSIESTVRPRRDLVLLMRELEDKIVVLFGATEISFPLFVRDAVDSRWRGRLSWCAISRANSTMVQRSYWCNVCYAKDCW